MPPGKGKFSAKQDRQVQHIKSSEQKSGKSAKQAESIAYGAVVNKQKGGKGKQH